MRELRGPLGTIYLVQGLANWGLQSKLAFLLLLYCLWVKTGFTFRNGWEKNPEKNSISWHMKIIWHSNSKSYWNIVTPIHVYILSVTTLWWLFAIPKANEQCPPHPRGRHHLSKDVFHALHCGQEKNKKLSSEAAIPLRPEWASPPQWILTDRQITGVF